MIDTAAIRKRILELAYQGSLTEQNTTDGNVDSLYSDIRKFVANKELPEVDSDECFADIPGNWKWVRVGNIAKINPKNEKDDDEDASFIPMAFVTEGFQNKHSFEIKKWGDIKKGFNHLCEGDIGVAKITPCFQNRKSVIFKNLHNGFGASTTELVILRTIEDFLLGEYLLYFFKTEYFILKGVESFTGVVGQQRIHKDYLKMSPIPLPPVEEQKRIVQKIKEAFELLDNIDAMQQQYSLDLEVLKSKIIDAGIQGKLTEQLPEDGTAEELLEQIVEEKKQLVKEKEIKKEKSFPEIGDEEIPFEIPNKWKWVRVIDIGITNTGSTPTKTNAANYGGNYPFFKPSDLDAGNHITKASEYLSELGKDASRQFSKGTILVCCIGSIGKSAIIDVDGTANQQINALTPIICDSNYIQFCIQSNFFKNQLLDKSRATTVSIIKKSKFDSCLIPLPSLAEQKRIAERIAEIIAMF